MNRHARHAPAHVGQPPLAVDGAETDEQLARRAPRRRRRRLEPRQGVRIADAERRQHQRQLGQIGAGNLGLGLARPQIEIVARVEAKRAPRAGATGAAGALGRRRLADLGERERRQAGPGRVRRLPREARIDDRGDAFDRDRRLGHVRRQDDLPPLAGTDRPRLILERHLAVQRQHREAADAGQLGERGLGPPDLARAGQEDQQIAVLVVPEDAADGARDLRGERPIVVMGQMLDGDVEHPPLAADGLAAQKIRDRIRVERRGHRHDRQIGTIGLAQPAQPRQRQVGRDVALVQLVEHDRAHLR